MEHKAYDYVVLGGGVSGLGFAKRMSESGKSVLILEKEEQVGGLSRSIEHKGFYLDFCAHRFHTNHKELLDEILALPGLEMNRHIKKSRIYMFNRWLKYPFEIQQLFRAMPITQIIPSGFSFVWAQVTKLFRNQDDLKSYKDWFVYLYGTKLYNIMCFPYTSKIWRHDPSEISADWADQRFKGEDMKKLIKRVIRKILTLNFSSYNLKDDSLAPDGGPFWYPLRGIQEMCDAMLRACEQNGVQVITGAHVTKVDTKTRLVTYKSNDATQVVEYKKMISTIPLHSYYHLQDERNAEVEKALDGLQYMDIIFVFLFIKKEQISNDHWLYFPDKEIIFNRAVEFSNWSPKMCPEGMTSVCFDITTFKNDAIWQKSDKELVETVIQDATRVGYIEREDIVDSLVTRVEYAYPYYDLGYKEKLDTIVSFLETDDVSLLGRTGIFRYNNSDNSIEMGFDLAERHIALDKGEDTKGSVYEYAPKAPVSY